MYSFCDPRQDPYDAQFRSISPPRSEAEHPRQGYFPIEYGCVSPLSRSQELGYPNLGTMSMGYEKMHYPSGRGRHNGGFWQGGAAGEWEHWR